MNLKGIFVLFLILMIGVVSCGKKNPVESTINREDEINWEEARKRIELIAEALGANLDANKSASPRLESPAESNSSPSFAPSYVIEWPPDENGWYITPTEPCHECGVKWFECKVRYLDENGDVMKFSSQWEYGHYIVYEAIIVNEERKETLIYYSGKVVEEYYRDRYVEYYEDEEDDWQLYTELYRKAQVEVSFPVSPLSGEEEYTISLEIDHTSGGGFVEYNKKDRSDSLHSWSEDHITFVTSDNWRGKMDRVRAKGKGYISNDKGVKIADITTDEHGNFHYRLLKDPTDKWQWIGVWL